MVKLSYGSLPCIVALCKLILVLHLNKFLNKLGVSRQLGLDYLFIYLPKIIILFVDLGLGRIVGMSTFESKKGGAPTEVLQRVDSNIPMNDVLAKPLFPSKDHVRNKTLEAKGDILKTQVQLFVTSIHILHCVLKVPYMILLIKQKFNLDKYVKTRKHRE